MHYFDARAEGYLTASQSGLWRWVRERESAAIHDLLEPAHHFRLLDLGCGAGYYSLLFAEQFNMQVLGVDASAQMIAAFPAHPSAIARHCTIENLDDDVGSFDRVLAAGVLEFTADPSVVFRQAARRLEPSGRLVILVPLPGIAGKIYRMAHEWKGCPTHIRSVGRYRAVAKAEGLTLLKAKMCLPLSVVLAFTPTSP